MPFLSLNFTASLKYLFGGRGGGKGERMLFPALVARNNSWYFLFLKGMPRIGIYGELVVQKIQKSV